jgi:hypothetical protein
MSSVTYKKYHTWSLVESIIQKIPSQAVQCNIQKMPCHESSAMSSVTYKKTKKPVESNIQKILSPVECNIQKIPGHELWHLSINELVD